MKKILAIAVAVMMVMALTVSVFAEEVIYSLGEKDTLGQHLETVTIGGGGVLPADDPDGVGSRIATNWVNGSTFDAILAAIKTDGAVVRITYTGTIKAIGYQSSYGTESFVNVTDVTEVDGKNVAIIPCADIAAAAPDVMNGGYDWCNFMVTQDGEVTLLAFEVVTGYEAAPAADEAAADDAAPADDAAADAPADDAAAEAPAADEAPAAEAAAPSTGLALAVIPAVVAMAAVAVSKKH